MFLSGIIALHGCASTREPVKPPRTGIEQLLLAQALEHSLLDLHPGVPAQGQSVYVTASASLTPTFDQFEDLHYVERAVAMRLATLGFRIVNDPDEATYRMSVLVQTLGTEQGVVFFGLPPIQSVIIPFALPEIALYKEQHEIGLTRWSLHVIDEATDQLVSSSPWYGSKTFFTQYTVFAFINWTKTNLRLPK